jgi:MFS family permease
MFPAFFLGLSPVVLRLHFGLTGGLVIGFTAFVGPFSAALAGFLFARHDPRRGTLVGLALVALGMVVVLAGVTATALPLVWVGALLGGAGFGGTFGGQVRLLAPHAGAHDRASLFSAVYTVAYLAFGLPVVIAGQLAPRWGLIATFEAYAASVIGLALLGLAVQGVRAAREQAESGAVSTAS